ncbi:hypothetical protein K8I85_11975 [bacterium]|nr:hypothetical protein [bacterium]
MVRTPPGSVPPVPWRPFLAALPFLWTMLLGVGARPAGAVSIGGIGLSFPDALPDEGDALELVGNIAQRAEMPFPLDLTQYEYTWTLTGPVCHDVEETAPGIKYRRLTFGILEIRRDPARNAAFMPFPPNAIVPSRFHDGEVLLMGTVTNLEIWEGIPINLAEADVHFEGGSALADLDSQAWSMIAGISAFGPQIPEGYGSHWTVDLTPQQAVSVESATWGGIKALYR